MLYLAGGGLNKYGIYFLLSGAAATRRSLTFSAYSGRRAEISPMLRGAAGVD
jgi:hypothetical protein